LDVVGQLGEVKELTLEKISIIKLKPLKKTINEGCHAELGSASSFKKCVSLQDGFRAKHGMTHFNFFKSIQVIIKLIRLRRTRHKWRSPSYIR
jgi:hypothetical protein